MGCGPGQLANRLARDHPHEVTGLDLDPAMIERARANATQIVVAERPPAFVVGGVAALPFPDGSFDHIWIGPVPPWEERECDRRHEEPDRRTDRDRSRGD